MCIAGGGVKEEGEGVREEGWGKWVRFRSGSGPGSGSGSVENITDPDPAKWCGNFGSVSSTLLGTEVGSSPHSNFLNITTLSNRVCFYL